MKEKELAMALENGEIIDALNDLIEINNDRIEGYEKAIEDMKDQEFKSLFLEMAARSKDFKSELSSELLGLGGNPTDSTKTSGKIFRIWMDLRTAVSGNDRGAILSLCERGEDAALETYDDVLARDVAFPVHVRSLIEEQRQGILYDHNRVRDLRDSEEASSDKIR